MRPIAYTEEEQNAFEVVFSVLQEREERSKGCGICDGIHSPIEFQKIMTEQDIKLLVKLVRHTDEEPPEERHVEAD